MGTCNYCRNQAKTISGTIGYCGDCIRTHFESIWPEIEKVHHRSRTNFGLPKAPPQAKDGVPCGFCEHRCSIPEHETGFCGLRYVKNGKVCGGRPHEGNLYYYHDPLPTNCVGNFVCAGGTGCGYPEYAVSRGPEYGHKNLAVFYHACGFNCLYCQNYHFKTETFSQTRISAKQLARAANENTSCICYFGGDPTPQILHAVKAAKIAIKKADRRILRICWETNGAMQEPYLSMMAELSLASGGCIKIDLKAWHDGIHHALCGVSNAKTLENFKVLAEWSRRRPNPPLLIASTLLVPGYVDTYEISAIARFIADLDPAIPYSLLAFYPQFYLDDLPTTSRSHAQRCRLTAEKVGLKNVHVGNVHLLTKEDYLA